MNATRSTRLKIPSMIVGALLLLACLLAPAFAHAAEPVKIGVIAYRTDPQRLAKWQPLAAVLKQAIPERDFVVEALAYPELDMAVATRQLDFVLSNPTHYIQLSKRNGLSAPLATLAYDKEGKAIAVSGGVIFCRAGYAKINVLADLRGKTIAATSTRSLGGYHAQAYELKQHGIQLPQDAKLLITGSPHDNVVAAVLSGRADAGFISTGELEAMARKGKLDMVQLKIINRQNLPGFPAQSSTRLYPGWVFAALPHIDENLSRHVVAALFMLEGNAAATKAMGIHGFVIPADYTVVSDMLRELRLPPFDAAPEFTLHDVWSQYRWWIIFSLFSAGLILLLGLYLLMNNRKLNAERRITLLQNQQLDESERRYRFLFNDNPMPMWVFAEGSLKFLEVNERAIEHYGFTREEFSRITLRDIRPAEDISGLNRVISSSPDGKVSVETRHKKKDGTLIDVAITTMPMQYGAALARIVLIQDITERKRAEEELKLSAQLLNSTSDTVFLLDLDGNFIYLNEAAWKSRGYTRDEMMAMNLRELNVPEYNKLLPSRIKAVLENGHGFFESAHRCKDGTVMPVEVNARVTETGGRKVLLSVIRDITERKAIQKQIADQLAFTEAVIHAEVNGLAVCHGIAEPPHVRFTVWNPSMEALTGFSMEEINHLGWYQTVYIDPEVQERARQRMERMRLGDHLHGEEWVITRKGGEHRVVQIHTMTVAGGDVGAHVLAVMHDITERKHAEMQLKNSEELYRQVMQTSMDGFWIVDTQGRILDVNDAYCQLLGYTREELLDMRVTDIEAKETPEETAQHMREIMTKGHVRFETHHRRKNGQLLFIEVSAVYRTDVGSGIFFVFLRDITERKEHEEELQRSNTDLEQFSYAVSHDMRQPLRMISSYLQLLEKSLAGQLDGEKRDYFNYAIEGAKRIDQMLVALLEYSRAGRMGEPPTWVESRALLDEALQFLQPVIDEAQAKVDIAGEWPRIQVSHDEILRLIQNLIGNAVKYRIAGRMPEITVSSKIDKNEWYLSIADNGVGIISDQIKRLFQVFQRLQSREAYEGTGIGLALCRKIAEHHKGRIWAESAGEGKGSRFCVALPVLRGDVS